MNQDIPPVTIDEILAPSRLAGAWAKLRANDGAAGEDAVTIQDLEESLPHLWPGIERSIRDGSYRPAPLRPVTIPKTGGGTRKLAIPSVVDRFVQHALASTLGPRWEGRFPKCSYAYRPGIGTGQAIRGILEAAAFVGHPVALRMDIRDFFDRIPHGAISRVLGATPCDEEVTALIHRSIQAPHASALGPVFPGLGIPQGSPLSPLLSNAVLLPFDLSFFSVPASLFRYADDMLVLCRDEAGAKQMLRHATEVLARIDLELNDSKTHIQPLEETAFLGIGFLRENGRWVRGLTDEARNGCLNHLCRMDHSGKSPSEMEIFLRQWIGYFLPDYEDQDRHAGFLRETVARFRLPVVQPGAARNTPPQGFTYSGNAPGAEPYPRLPWALRFLLRRVRFGLQFRRRGLMPIPSGLHITIAGHRIHFRL